MKSFPPFFAAVCVASSAFAQQAAVPSDYELAPVLHASDVLKPEVLMGPNHQVLQQVMTVSGRNSYMVETRWGFFSAEGDALLEARVAEAEALGQLEKVSTSDEYKESLKAAAKAPLHAVAGLVDDPAGALKGTARGVWKFVNRAGDSIKGAAEGRKPAQGEDNAAKQLLGLSKAKRSLALQVGTDPYSSNPVFQEQLEKVAWTSTAGSLTFKLLTLPVGGGVGIALSGTQMSSDFQQSLRDMSPGDLRMDNKKRLLAMKVSAGAADTFLANPAFSPTNQTAFVRALSALKGVQNRAAFVALATEISSDEADAIFCSRTAQLLAALHLGDYPLERIATVGGFPVAVDVKGRLVVALQWDTAFWSEGAEQFIERAATATLGQTGPLMVAITGNATARAKEELEKRHILLLTRVLDGPQR